MILERITLEGFLSYKKKQVISFEDIHICLVNGSVNGDPNLSNGAGKSGLFESIPVCWFGKVGGRSDKLDSYINHDMNEMYNEVIFKIDGNRYKTIRTKPRNSSGTFEIYYDSESKKLKDADWHIVKDRNIEDILGLSSLTCNSTIYLSEREAIKFINGTSSDRKDILRELLNIKIYEISAKKCKSKAEEFDKKITINLRLIQSKKEEIEKEDEIKENHDEISSEIPTLERKIKNIEKKKKKIEESKKNIEIKIEKRKVILDQIQLEEETIGEYEETISNRENKIKRNNEYLENLMEKLDEEIKNKTNLNIKKETFEESIQDLESEKESYKNLDKSLKEVKGKIRRNSNQLKEKEKENSSLNTEIKQIKKLLDKIDEFGSVCPVTEESCPVMDDSYKGKYIKDKQSILDEKKESKEEILSDIEKLEEEESKLKKEEEKYFEDIEEKDRISREINSFKEELNNVKDKFKDIENKENEYKSKNKEVGEEEKELKEEISNLKNKIEEHSSKIQDLKSKLKDEEDLELELDNYNLELEELREQLEEKNNNLQELNEKIILLKNNLERIKQIKEDIDEMLKTNEELSIQKEIFLNLTSIFGKEGIQKAIMKKAIPFLEETSLELLKIFNNDSEKIKIKFDLDPKTSSGDLKKRGGLDILILEEGREPKDLKMYSGGETVRLVFSILLGLAKLLSKRSGKRHETLIIDEKIAKLDKRGIEQFSEIIDTISKWYKKIFIITHIESLKEMFDEKEILINKTEEYGSIISVN